MFNRYLVHNVTLCAGLFNTFWLLIVATNVTFETCKGTRLNEVSQISKHTSVYLIIEIFSNSPSLVTEKHSFY